MELGTRLKPLSKRELLKVVSEHDIYNFYLGGKVVYNKAFSSPLREDKNPSFIIRSKSMVYKDFSTGDYGDCFQFVNKLMGGNLSFYDSLKQVSSDMGLDDRFLIRGDDIKSKGIKGEVKNVLNKEEYSDRVDIKVKVRSFEKHDLEYWESYGIDEKYLRIGKVFPISHYFMNGKQFRAQKYAYVYVEMKDGNESYKIYQPFSKTYKWINSNDYSVWELWTLLPETYDKLIITSSRKDALAIIKNFGLPATSFQAESVKPKEHVVEEIKSRFEKIYLFYDNDFDNPNNPGQTLAERNINEFGFTNLYIPEKYGCKDFSDLIHEYGVKFSCQVLAEIMRKADEFNAYNPKIA